MVYSKLKRKLADEKKKERKKLDLKCHCCCLQPTRIAETHPTIFTDVRFFLGSYEIIVTDYDSSPKLFHVCQDELDKSLIPIKYVWQQDRHFRVAAARNNGINISGGKILLFLDEDLVPALDTLRKHVEAHTSPKMMVVGNRKWRGKFSDIRQLPNEPIEDVIKFLENIPVDEKKQAT